MLTADFLSTKFDAAAHYHDYVKTGTDSQQDAWRKIYDQTALSDRQRELLKSFTREMHILVVSGVWCGDCVQQCPFLARIAEENPEKIRLRFLDRDEHTDLAEQVQICAGMRVPLVLFLAEDFHFVSLLGDRTLTRYRAIAARQLGPSCPVPGAPLDQDEADATLQDWLDEIERVQLLLRLSTRLRRKHND